MVAGKQLRMSKRKRHKPKSAQRGPNQRKRPAGEPATPAEAVPPKRQRGLLWVAVFVLAMTAGINLLRLKKNSVPAALPLPSEVLVSTPLAKPSQSDGKTRFTALAARDTGIDFVHRVHENHPMAYLYFSSSASGGTAIGDVSGDGRPDVFVASGPDSNRLYIQQGDDFQFQDVTSRAGVAGGDRWACGATMVDINSDGRLDIFVANYDAPNQLFVNLGANRFEDLAPAFALNMTDASLEGSFADYDRDGDLDLYLLTYRYEDPNGMPVTPPIISRRGRRAIHPDFEKYYTLTNDDIGFGTIGRFDHLLRNNGDGTFSNVTPITGIYGPGHGQSVIWWDFDQDGFVDLHVGNDFNDPDRLYRNNGDGTFTDIVRESVPHTSWFSMGSDTGDVNGDGLPDLLSADMSSTTHFKQKTTMGSMDRNAEFLSTAVPRQYMRNALLLNSTAGRFQEAAYLAGLESTDWTWAVKLADFDCDGLIDAFFTNGSIRSFTDSDLTTSLAARRGKTEWDIYKHTEPLREKNLAFQNSGDLQFRNVSEAWGLDHLGVSMSSAHGDLDGDGDLDLVVANVDEPLIVYRNDTTDHRRVTLRLHGLEGNRFGVGARVRVTSEGGEQQAELQPTRGFLASNQPHLHFGCGDAKSVDVEVAWPDGTLQQLTGLKTNCHHVITQQAGLPMARAKSVVSRLFETKPVAALAHAENSFNDYQLQPLLPFKMSALGPALASADVNGDGTMDLFVGGSAGQPGYVAFWSEQGNTYQLSNQPALLADKAYEDMAAVWLDVDADGDVDLFIASGGNEQSMDSGLYAPRLYLNDGQGKLLAAPDRLPDLQVSAGPVAASDFDQDGDVDLFLGGRQVPGKYPLPATSYLLVNEDGTFQDKTNDYFAGRVTDLGMVTGALWSDVDNDSDLDLFVTLEWGSVQLFRNDPASPRGRKLVNATASSGLSGYRGWWTGITGADVDQDGDIDYVATNLGLNTKYHASDEKPFRIYYGDFAGDGTRKLVEAEYEADTLFPVRGRSCSTHAVPTLAEKFTSYKEFAAATLQEIYTPQCLEDAYQCSANFLASAVFLNDGTGQFEVKPLPREAQMSPGFGAIVTDVDGDAMLDVFIAQNFFSPQPETGNMDGGLGCLLRGQGDGSFVAMPASETGIVIPQDASAVVIADLNPHAGVDLVVAVNDGPLQVLLSKHSAEVLRCRIEGARSCSEVAGMKIRCEIDGKTQSFEIASGGGYLSQQPPLIYFSNPKRMGGRIEFTSHKGIAVCSFDAEQTEVVLDLQALVHEDALNVQSNDAHR